MRTTSRQRHCTAQRTVGRPMMPVTGSAIEKNALRETSTHRSSTQCSHSARRAASCICGMQCSLLHCRSQRKGRATMAQMQLLTSMWSAAGRLYLPRLLRIVHGCLSPIIVDVSTSGSVENTSARSMRYSGHFRCSEDILHISGETFVF